MSTKLKKKRPAFMLYETILSLMITVMTLGILQQSLQILRTIQHTSFRDQVRWHVTNEKLQDLLGKHEIFKVEEKQIIYYAPENSKDKKPDYKMILEAYGPKKSEMLRIMTAEVGGHEPIMMNLNKIKIEKIENLVIITTENKVQQTSMMCIVNEV